MTLSEVGSEPKSFCGRFSYHEMQYITIQGLNSGVCKLTIVSELSVC